MMWSSVNDDIELLSFYFLLVSSMLLYLEDKERLVWHKLNSCPVIQPVCRGRRLPYVQALTSRSVIKL